MEGKAMAVIAVTTWEGTPAAIERLVEGAKNAKPLHAEMGAKSIKLLRSTAGGAQSRAYYMAEFDSHQSYGAFIDKVLESDWYQQTMQATAEGHPDIRIAETALYYDALA